MTTQGDLFAADNAVPANTTPDVVAHARHTDPVTSHYAAASVSTSSSAIIRDMLARHLAHTVSGYTDEEIALWYATLVGGYCPKCTPSGLRTRRSELVREGLAYATSRLGRTTAGRVCKAWALTEKGREWINGGGL